MGLPGGVFEIQINECSVSVERFRVFEEEREDTKLAKRSSWLVIYFWTGGSQLLARLAGEG
jgi:hypothetical protein